MLAIIAVGVVRESRNFQGTHVWGALGGHLCDSTAFLSYQICDLMRLFISRPIVAKLRIGAYT